MVKKYSIEDAWNRLVQTIETSGFPYSLCAYEQNVYTDLFSGVLNLDQRSNPLSQLAYVYRTSTHSRYASVHDACLVILRALADEWGKNRVARFCADDGFFDHFSAHYYLFIRTKTDLYKSKQYLSKLQYKTLELLDFASRIQDPKLTIQDKKLLVFTLCSRYEDDSSEDYRRSIVSLIECMQRTHFLDDCPEETIHALFKFDVREYQRIDVPPQYYGAPQSILSNSASKLKFIRVTMRNDYHNDKDPYRCFRRIAVEDWPLAAALAFLHFRHKRPPYMEALPNLTRYIQEHGSSAQAIAFELVHDLLYRDSHVINFSPKSYHRDDFRSWQIMESLVSLEHVARQIIHDVTTQNYVIENGIYKTKVPSNELELDTLDTGDITDALIRI